MKQMTFTHPGKIGDTLMAWPLAFWWHQENQTPFDLWLDENTGQPLVNLLKAQPGVSNVELKPGIENWSCGGQPWHFNLEARDHDDRQFSHLGLRAFPQRQLTLQAREDSMIGLNVTQRDLAETPSLQVPDSPKANRVVLHGTGICLHNRLTPGFWKFVARIRKDLESKYAEIVFVGNAADREIGLSTYPEWKEFDDEGDFLKLGSFMKASELVIGCGSSNVVLAGALKVPCVRVHDPLGDAPKHIWSNLGSNQMNATEHELRSKWPEFNAEVLV